MKVCSTIFLTTYKELRQRLSLFGENTEVAVRWERDDGSSFLEIRYVSKESGKLKTGTDGKSGFEFDPNGPVTMVLIGVDDDS